MKTVFLEEKYILEYIKDIIQSMTMRLVNIDNARYHHNTSYRDAVSICKYGILTMSDLKKLQIKEYTEEFLSTMSDVESHVNGTDAVSLAVVGLQDLYPDEDEFDPFNPSCVDFLVSSDIMAGRSSTNYGNEFLSYRSIDVDKFKSVDIRLLQLLDLVERKINSNYYSTKDIINNYNYLKDIALMMKNCKLNIPLREMSYQNVSLDIDKLVFTPKLVLK